LGTPFYMTPEQFMGKPVDQRSDIYAMSLIFYELLAGRSPFDQSLGGGNPLMQAASAHLYHVPPAIQPQRPQHNVPAQMEALIMQALSKHPEERPPSIDQYMLAMQSWTQRAAQPAAASASHASHGPQTDAQREHAKKLSRLRGQRFVAGSVQG